nr:alanine racemase [Pseudonocardia sp. C8]
MPATERVPGAGTGRTGRPTAGGPRAEAVIDLGAVRHNVAHLSGLAGRSGAATMVVIKADGYGHGAPDVARAALAAGATRLGVATLDEALAVRAAGVDAPLLAWLHLPDEDFAAAVAAGVELSVSSREHLAAVLAGARAAGRTVRLHLKADTGLNRGGCRPEEWPELLDDAAAAVADGTAEVAAVWSHLARADEPGDPSIDAQAVRLRDAAARARERGFDPLLHLANSAATLTRPDLHFDLVRPGIAAYGLDPVAAPADSPLRPAMTVRGRIALLKTVPPGEGVSYGHEWVATEPRVLALIPLGYADGVPRRMNNGGRMRVRVGGVIRPVAGRVCMDQFVVDCGRPGELDVAVGDPVELFGTGDGGGPTAQEWADELGTIHYEIVTGIKGRVRRTVTGGTA